MENNEKIVPVNNTTDNTTNTQEVQQTSEIQPASISEQVTQPQASQEVQLQPTSEVQSASNVSVENVNFLEEEEANEETIKVDGNTVTIDAQPYISHLFSKNPGEISKVFNMDLEQLKKEQDRLKRKGTTMDNRYANLFLLQSIRDECGVLVMGSLASWFLTRIGLSIYWILFIIVATAMAYITYNNRKKHLYYNKERKAYNQKVRLNPENPETLNWLNYILRKAWPTVEPIIGDIVMDNVNGILDSIEIGLDSIKISEFTLGTEAPKLMEIYPNTDSDPNVIKFTCLTKYEPLDTNKISKYEIESGEKRASNIVLAIKPTSLVPKAIPTQVTDMLFVGKLLFVITTMETFPYVKKVEFTFLEQPSIKWTLKPLSAGIDIMKFGLDSAIELIVKKIIAHIALEPTRISIDVEDQLKSMTLDQPIGLLKLNIYEGKELKNTSKMGKDDPYAKVTVNGSELARTKVIDNDLNPSWNHIEYAIVSGLIYSDPKNNSDLALIEVMSDNNIKRDNVMGRAENFYLRQYIALSEILQREKLEEEREAAFVENLNKQGVYDVREIARIRKEENKKRKKELLLNEKNKSFAQKLLSSLEASAETYINGLTDIERKEYMDKWGNPLIESDTIIPLYQVDRNNIINKKKPAGNVRMSIHYIPLNQFNENLEDEKSADMFSETGIARIWIYKVQKLEKNPNPYCVAEIDGVEVLRTPKKKYNNNPGYNSFKDVFIKNFSTAKLTINVKDSETGTDSTLGTFSWGLYEINERLKEDPGANWFKLSSKFEEAVINLGLEWKPMIMDMSSNIQKPIGVCRLHILGARNLKNINGVVDPYVKIYLSGKEIGVTDVVENDVNPEFNEVYYFMVRSKNDRLSFEAYDYSESKTDRKLGKVEMNVTDLCRDIKFNGEQCSLSKAWENMTPSPLVIITPHQKTGVSVPLFENQSAQKVTQGNLEFNLKYFDFADLGLEENEEDKENEKKEDLISQNILASENTDRTFIDKVQASNLPSGILRVKIYGVNDLPKPAFFNIDTYFEDEPSNILLSTKKSPKPVTEGNIDEIVESFVRNYKNSKLIFDINERSGNNGRKMTSLAIPIEQLITGKLGIDCPFIHICDDGSTKIKLGVEYHPLNMQLERSELSPQMGTLNVHIDRADVIAKDTSGTSDPYVKVLLRGEEIYRTDTFKKTLTPIWNENFSIDIADRLTNKLVFQVFDWNKVQKHGLIGQADVPLHEVYDNEKINIKILLYDYNKSGKAETGSISLGLEFIPDIHNKKMRDRFGSVSNTALRLAGGVVGGVGTVAGGVVGGVGTVAGSVGSVAGSVASGVASGVGSLARGIGIKRSNKHSGKSNLKIKLIKAEGLKAVDNSGTSDPYIKVQHQKKTLYKTKVAKKTLNPTWNEKCTIPFDRETSDPIISFIIKDNNMFAKSVNLGLVNVNINEVLFDSGQISINKDFAVQNGPGKLTLQIDYNEDTSVTNSNQSLNTTQTLNSNMSFNSNQSLDSDPNLNTNQSLTESS